MRTKRRKTRPAEEFVGGVRPELMGRGFALVDTSRFFDDDLFLRLRMKRLVMSHGSKGWRKYPELAGYACRLEQLLRKALPEEAVGLAVLEFRREPAGSEDVEVDRWHADGSYLRSVFAPYGPATVYRDGKAERSVPRGHTLLMTALDRARALHVPCTLHRRPGAGPERAVIVCSFEPRAEELGPA